MHGIGIESLVHGLLLGGYVLITVLLAIAGVIFEYYSFVISASNPSAGLWVSALGVGSFCLAYLVLSRRIVPTIRTIRKS